MSLLNRISRLVRANINHLLDQAEDPELMVKQLIRDMEESLVEVHREAVRAVARQKTLEKQITATEDSIRDLEEKARLVLSQNDEPLAKQILTKKLHILNTHESLQGELKNASHFAGQLRSTLTNLKNRLEEAKRKRDEVVSRHRAAEAQLKAQEISRRSAETLSTAAGSMADFQAASQSLESYKERIIMLESEAQAMQEILESDIKKELDLQKIAEEDAVDKELQRLKKDLQK